jgi:hypothetical protein
MPNKALRIPPWNNYSREKVPVESSGSYDDAESALDDEEEQPRIRRCSSKDVLASRGARSSMLASKGARKSSQLFQPQVTRGKSQMSAFAEYAKEHPGKPGQHSGSTPSTSLPATVTESLKSYKSEYRTKQYLTKDYISFRLEDDSAGHAGSDGRSAEAGLNDLFLFHSPAARAQVKKKNARRKKPAVKVEVHYDNSSEQAPRAGSSEQTHRASFSTASALQNLANLLHRSTAEASNSIIFQKEPVLRSRTPSKLGMQRQESQ